MEMNNQKTTEKLELKYLRSIENHSLSDLAYAYEQPLDNLTDFVDLLINIYEEGMRFLFADEEFLNLPVLAHYESEEHNIFLIESYPRNEHNVIPYRALYVNKNDGSCALSFQIQVPQRQATGSQYKIVRDILPLIGDYLL